MQLTRLLFVLSALTATTFAAPNKAHELVARLPKSSALWSKLSGQNVDIFGATTSTLDVRVTRAQLDAIVKENSIDNSAVKILIPDLDKLISEERDRLRSVPQEGIEGNANVDWHTEYHTYEDIKKFVGKLAQDNPDLAKFTPSIGKTIEGRDLFMLKVTGTGGDYAKKQRAFMVCMQHAREWISGATAQYLAEHLISAYKAGDSRIVKLLDQVEFVIVPVSNPDGYAHTWTSGGRMWRKNRARNAKGRIVGVDVNRNWPAHWGQVGASRDENSETYGGVAPASELETQALIKAFKSTPNVYFSIDLHSYSEVFMRPWAYLTDDTIRTPHESQFLQITEKFIEAVKKVKGTTYTALTRLYPVSGGARDWAYDEGRAYSVTIELSPDSESDIGFVLPPQEIKRVGEEMWNGIVTAAETALTLPKIPAA